MEKLYSARDIQTLFGVKVGRVRYWDRIGFLTPSVKIGRRKYYTPQDLIGLRTAKGLLDAGLPFAKVRRAVVDVKKVSCTIRKPPSQLLIHGEKKGIFLNEVTFLSNPSGQLLIGFSRKDFEKGVKSVNIQFEQDFRSELKERRTARGKSSRIRGAIKPNNP
ncbi:MAG: MerR family transcriptional regulator [Proteobacteria bacterium]|nr:MerR family transcriptional regulator [Pseudomonadota bacterium]